MAKSKSIPSAAERLRELRETVASTIGEVIRLSRDQELDPEMQLQLRESVDKFAGAYDLLTPLPGHRVAREARSAR
jgi:hypothetical protein